MLKAVPSTRLEFRLRRKAARRTAAGEMSDEFPLEPDATDEGSYWASPAACGFESRRMIDEPDSETADLSGAITGVGRTSNTLAGGAPEVVERLDFRTK